MRNNGAGRALVTELCEIARRTGCARIDWIVARDNEKGSVFYARLGAKIFEQVRHARLDEQAIAEVVADGR
jgi:ribosomal protein S18 acetylase RimI-like enzyme